MKLSDIRDHVQDFDWKECVQGMIILTGVIVVFYVLLVYINL